MNEDTIDKITNYYGYGYIISCLCMFGILCNIINLYVLSSRRLKESSYTYLSGLAWSDLLTLLFTFTTTFTRGQWIEYQNGTGRELWLKKLERSVFLPSANLFSALSISITVALTIDRYLFIKFPTCLSSKFSNMKAKKIMFILAILVLIFRIPMYFFNDVIAVYDLNSTESNAIFQDVIVIQKYEYFQEFYYLVSFILFEIIPFCILSTLNFNLLLLLRRSIKELEISDEKKLKSQVSMSTYFMMGDSQKYSSKIDSTLMEKRVPRLFTSET